MQSNDSNTTIEILKTLVKKFVTDRKWEHYHNPKDLAIALCVETAELANIYKWKKADTEEVKNTEMLDKTKEEIADIMIYILHMSNLLSIDLAQTVIQKLKSDEKKYPIESDFKW